MLSIAHLGSRVHGVERPREETHPGRNVQDEPFPPKRQRSKVSGALLPQGSVRRKKTKGLMSAGKLLSASRQGHSPTMGALGS